MPKVSSESQLYRFLMEKVKKNKKKSKKLERYSKKKYPNPRRGSSKKL